VQVARSQSAPGKDPTVRVVYDFDKDVSMLLNTELANGLSDLTMSPIWLAPMM